MKQLIVFALFLSIMPICMAQEEVFFNDINVDKKEIKVARTISGLGFDADFIRVLPGQYIGYIAGSVETHFSYFHESRIANTWTFYKSIGLGNAFYHIRIYDGNPSGGYGSDPGSKVFRYEMSLDLKLEPRWYFDHRLRYRHNKSTRNNSGWFLSLPLTISTNLLRQPVDGINTQWFPEQLSISIIAPPTIGYRNSFAENWFIEASLGYIPYWTWWQKDFTVISAKQIGVFSADSFNSELKIAYTF